MTTAITTNEVRAAASELARMRGSLASWLRYRQLNDQVLAGTARVRKPIDYAKRVVATSRDVALEQDIATKLHSLLEVVMPGMALPSADVRANPSAAVQLAQIALAGGSVVSSPTAAGGIFAGAQPWLWPALIVGAVLLTVTTAISTAADVAKDREEKACIMAGACTDYGFWLKAGGIVALGWFAWTQMGGRELVHSVTKKDRK